MLCNARGHPGWKNTHVAKSVGNFYYPIVFRDLLWWTVNMGSSTCIDGIYEMVYKYCHDWVSWTYKLTIFHQTAASISTKSRKETRLSSLSITNKYFTINISRNLFSQAYDSLNKASGSGLVHSAKWTEEISPADLIIMRMKLWHQDFIRNYLFWEKSIAGRHKA